MASLVRSAIVAALLALVVAAVAFERLDAWARAPLVLYEPTIVELASGESFSAFASNLQAAGVIEHGWLFAAYARMKGQATRVQAGEYRLGPGLTPQALLADLIAGNVVTYDVRIVEGGTIMRVVRQLAETQKLINDVGDVTVETLLAKLRLPAGNAEGRFFPDTYGYKKGTRASEVLLRAHERMRDVLAREWASRDPGLPYADPEQALIMASIIEKETGRDDERAKISRVFVSRLQQAMRLQTDPTVIYGLGESFDGNLTREDLDADGPYNTYKQSGLPPTPIALPSLASIRAALHPDAGNYLYFVARGDGTSEFSATLDEHLAAVRRYQLAADTL